ncbi:MAG: glycosyltransferase [Candidatus Bathyarchaeota archaeon]|nr:glycosyltransferase [Candidatus Bathyarchaeota archaeon]
MSETVLVSVVMCSYNHEKYISQAIESVLNQTARDLELIITDDCSKDSSQEIIESYKQKDPRVNAVFHRRNMGITKTLNDGLGRVHGKYVCFLDSDDLWMENKIEKQLEVLRQDDRKILWSDGIIINDEGQKTGQVFTKFLNAPHKKNGDLFQPMLREQFILLQTVILKAEYLKELQFADNLGYVNDHRLLVDLAVHHTFRFMPEHLAKYRLHRNNITFQKEKEWAKDKIRIRRYFLDRFSDKMSSKAKADINYQIGYYLSRLDKREEAKKYYLQALKIDHTHTSSVLYATLALTRGDGLLGGLMLNSYNGATRLLDTLKSAIYTSTIPQ